MVDVSRWSKTTGYDEDPNTAFRQECQSCWHVLVSLPGYVSRILNNPVASLRSATGYLLESLRDDYCVPITVQGVTDFLV